MIKDVIVIDDILPKSYQDSVEEEMLGMNVSWYHLKDVAFSNRGIQHLTSEGWHPLPLRPGFSFRLLELSEGIRHPLWPLVHPIVAEACKRIDFPLTQVIAARSFLTTSLADKVEYDNPHTDLNISHLVCLYYVNDSDGDTFLFDQRADQTPWDKLDMNKLQVMKRISPKKGRVLLFDGRFYHASSRPSTGSRCVINFDVV
jgi:hypothetical protein